MSDTKSTYPNLVYATMRHKKYWCEYSLRTHATRHTEGGVKSKCHKGVIMGGGGQKWLILVSYDLWTFPKAGVLIMIDISPLVS